jgi:hypothetical protein
MTKDEAVAKAIKETDYCYVLAGAWEAAPDNSITLERIYPRSVASRKFGSLGGIMGIRQCGRPISTRRIGSRYSPRPSKLAFSPTRSSSAC